MPMEEPPFCCPSWCSTIQFWGDEFEPEPCWQNLENNLQLYQHDIFWSHRRNCFMGSKLRWKTKKTKSEWYDEGSFKPLSHHWPITWQRTRCIWIVAIRPSLFFSAAVFSSVSQHRHASGHKHHMSQVPTRAWSFLGWWRGLRNLRDPHN
jgi:hypothetical protein